MKIRFYLIAILMCLLLASWIWLEQQYEVARQDKYEQLSGLPIYVYVADSTKVATLMERLSEFPNVSQLHWETGLQAADELVEAYQLSVGKDELLHYRFPSIITINFAPKINSLKEKPAVMTVFEEMQIELSDVDAQSNAWMQIETEIHKMQVRWLSFTVIYAVMMALLFFFIRFSQELRSLMAQKSRYASVADSLRQKTQYQRDTWVMLVLPLLASIGGYFLLHLLKYNTAIIPLWWFVIPAASLVTATIAVSIVMNRFYHNLKLAPDTDIFHEA
ncbi:MAG: hypothetical protein LHW44_06200 [Candidatus Cloacimonetes bacterium]|nr:hypothetical protein [Candidatus Cloacimonadota bacterium]